MAMTTVLTYTRESHLGPWARRMRMSLHMSQQELADIVGVSEEEVDLFEHSLPITLDVKCKLLRELYAAKAPKNIGYQPHLPL